MGVLVLGYCLREDFGIRWSIAIECSSLLMIFQGPLRSSQNTEQKTEPNYQSISGFCHVMNFRVLEIKLDGHIFR